MSKNQMLASIANLRTALEAGAAVLCKTGLCNPQDSAEIGRMLWEVSVAKTPELQLLAVRALEEKAGWVGNDGEVYP